MVVDHGGEGVGVVDVVDPAGELGVPDLIVLDMVARRGGGGRSTHGVPADELPSRGSPVGDGIGVAPVVLAPVCCGLLAT